MNLRINIFSNFKHVTFFEQLLTGYEIKYMKLNDLIREEDFNDPGIIFLNNDYDTTFLKSKKFKNKHIVLIQNNKTQNNQINNLFFINYPVSIEILKKNIKNFFSDMNIIFKNIEIQDLKLINKKNNQSCLLTNVEKDILTVIFNDKSSSKRIIKQNILKIKTDLQTNSLESHLTRIRKKFDKLEIKLKIQSKNDNLMIV